MDLSNAYLAHYLLFVILCQREVALNETDRIQSLLAAIYT